MGIEGFCPWCSTVYELVDGKLPEHKVMGCSDNPACTGSNKVPFKLVVGNEIVNNPDFHC